MISLSIDKIMMLLSDFWYNFLIHYEICQYLSGVKFKKLWECIFISFHFSKYIFKILIRLSQDYKQDSIEVLEEAKIKNIILRCAMGIAPNWETIFRKIVKSILQYFYQTNNSKYKPFAEFFHFIFSILRRSFLEHFQFPSLCQCL